MPFGSIFRKFKSVNFVTADNIHVKFMNNSLSRVGFAFLGMPHIGLRLRANLILKEVPKSAEKMLDAGFGTGIYSLSLANKIKEIKAIDISDEKVNEVKKESVSKNICFEKGDLRKLQFEDNYFDLIICSDVLEHIREDYKAFSELARVLKKGGTLLLTVPANSKKNKETYRLYGHERPGYELCDIKEFCKNRGLKIIKNKEYSSSLTEKLSSFNYNLTKNRFLLGLFFYPVYFASLISDRIGKDYNGLFLKIKKV